MPRGWERSFVCQIRHATHESYRQTEAQGKFRKFSYVLSNGRATFTPDAEVHCDEEIESEFEQMVSAWNISALLTLGPDAFELIPEIAGRQSPPAAKVTDPVIVHDAYPEPDDIAVNSCVLQLAALYADQLREPQNTVQYGRACLIALEQWYTDREHVAAVLNVDVKVLNRLSAITRKWGRDSVEQPRFSTWRRASRWLSGKECAWLERVMRELTYRAARHAAGHIDPQTFSQLPGG